MRATTMRSAILVCLCSASLSLSQQVGVQARAQEPDQDPKRLVENPYDFSEPPTLPDVDAPSQIVIQQSIDRGIDFLVQSQRVSGAWGSATRTKDLNIYAPVPGAHDAFRIATTAMCVTALLETKSDSPEVEQAIDKAEAWLMDQLPTLKRATGDAIYNCWGHGYSIPALLLLQRRPGIDQEKKRKLGTLVELQLKMLDGYESVDGGWGYYDFRYQAKKPTSDSTSFLNATVLVEMHRAKQAGFEPTEKVIKRAIAATVRQRKPDFTYLYGEYLKNSPMAGINRPGGSLGRSQACNVALRLWGDDKISDNVLKHWLVRLYERNGWLDMGRKRPVPHESWMQVAGYFYFYGHYYAALCIEQLQTEHRGPYQSMLARIIIDRQEKNGSWWDYPLYDYHQPYGTAFALMTLQRCLAAGGE